MVEKISAKTLKHWLHDGNEIALFDVREHGQYGEGHLFYAIPLPFSVLEQEVFRLAPNARVRVVLYDNGVDSRFGTVAERVAQQLQLLGYTAVHVLEGGAPAWAAAGYVLYKGVNLPSKAFGELVEQVNHTPHIGATELARRLQGDTPPIVLDGRPFAEFQKMSIPQAICCPNGELAYRITSLVPDSEKTIVINCAGRTRSIIGAQTLINLGIENPVFALENGTQGWFLDDLALDHGKQLRYADQTDPDRHAQLAESAAALAKRAGVEWVTSETVARWWTDPARTVFLCDVRTAEEFAGGTLAGAQHTPGGQLQQATDQYIGVRRARLVLFDSDGVRAPVVASWLRQLGHAAYVLAGGVKSGVQSGLQLPMTANGTDIIKRETTPSVPAITVAHITVTQLAEKVRRTGGNNKPINSETTLSESALLIVDLRASQAFRDAHIPGSRWSIRPLLAEMLAALEGNIVLVSDTPSVALWAAAELPPALRARVGVLQGGFTAWRAAGEEVASSPNVPSDAERIDFLFFTHDRHHGNKAAARQYLEWEMGLLPQLDEQELGDFAPLQTLTFT